MFRLDCWKKHSLTIVAALITFISYIIGEQYQLKFMTDVGHAFLSIVGMNVLSYKFREVRKPDD